MGEFLFEPKILQLRAIFRQICHKHWSLFTEIGKTWLKIGNFPLKFITQVDTKVLGLAERELLIFFFVHLP